MNIRDIKNIKYIKKFIYHNFKNFKKQEYKNDYKILVEVYDYKPSTIPISYLSNVLAQKHRANLIGYYPSFLSFKNKFKRILFDTLNPYGLNKIYESFGITKFIIPKRSNDRTQELLYNKTYKKIKFKKDILELKLDGILLGDLFYDEYLRSNNVITIDVNTKNFQSFLKEAISLYFFWKKIFEKEKIKSLIISHHVYFMGIVTRIAIYKNIPVYNIGITNIQYLTKSYPIKHCGFENYLKFFKKFNSNLQKKLLIDAENKLTERFAGKKDIKLLMDRHTDKDFYNKKVSTKKILSQDKYKVLIAAHQFNDAVHVYGKFLFNDFYEWIDFLGKCTKKTDYEWYIKFHPAEFKTNYKYIKYFAKKYPKFIILPNTVTNNQLIKEKVDIILTVYGSIGHEYPLFGIPVVNASNEGPHKPFDFNIYPKNFVEYERIILNLHKVPKVKVNLIQRKLYIYYLMRFLLDYNLIDNFRGELIKLGSDYSTGKIYDIFLKQLQKKNNNNEILKVYNDYINSKKFRIYSNNLNKKTELIGFY